MAIRVRGTFQSSYANENLQSNNITATQSAQEIKSNGLKVIYDIVGAGGGALQKDRLWYYGAFRRKQEFGST